MSRVLAMALGVLIGCGPGRASAQTVTTAESPDGSFRNPLKVHGADPWLMHHDGWYYLTATTGVDVQMRKARRLGELKDAVDYVVWKDDDPSRNRDVWAPEFHRLDGGTGIGPRWYLYFTASDGREPHHRMYVAESAGDDPMGPYTFKAKLLTDPKDEFYAIDGTVLTMPDGSRYFVWCGRPSTAGQGLYISRMTNPWTLTGPRLYLEVDGFGCEHVREGPVALRQDGHDRTFLIYSACGADTPDYKLGMLSIAAGDDPMDPAGWKQHTEPVFTRNDAAKVYGPGHNSFFRSPNGREDWIAYHAKTDTNRGYADRSARAQKFTWNADGTPNFGKPVGTDVDVAPPSGEPKPGR
ncbi:MAG: glycoside hydrolase family 43 protein [Paludisphaera borealis]|uniref:glycoside hydrolase family 43 protein n=1 Tax=Paludisphaera borealis TaxID=1387353 RepID=UPI002850DCFC|nr:glycoside hydrolase family 43 protein [Paludisphaera borealis]MDR3622229.1 glycoside hydrolase family 43 protein [Paludisphaera borealis]